MTLVRKFNRLLNLLSFQFGNKIYFIHDGKISLYKQNILSDIISIHAECRSDYSKAVIYSQSVRDLAAFLNLSSKTKEQKINSIVEFYHSIPYTRDNKLSFGDDVKTVYGGLLKCKLDCEDFAVGIATMLLYVGISAHLVWIQRPSGSSDQNHCIACISEDYFSSTNGKYISSMGKKYYLIEGTADVKIGYLNDKYLNWEKYLIDCSQRRL